MDPTAYRGMNSFMRDLPPQVPVNDQPQEQAPGEQERLPGSDWTVYSMDVRISLGAFTSILYRLR